MRWAHDPTTKVNVIAGGIRMLLELLAVRWNARKGRYPRVAPEINLLTVIEA